MFLRHSRRYNSNIHSRDVLVRNIHGAVDVNEFMNTWCVDNSNIQYHKEIRGEADNNTENNHLITEVRRNIPFSRNHKKNKKNKNEKHE